MGSAQLFYDTDLFHTVIPLAWEHAPLSTEFPSENEVGQEALHLQLPERPHMVTEDTDTGPSQPRFDSQLCNLFVLRFWQVNLPVLLLSILYDGRENSAYLDRLP